MKQVTLNDIFKYIDDAFNRTPYEDSWITDTGERVSCDVGYAYDWWNNYMKPELIRTFGENVPIIPPLRIKLEPTGIVGKDWLQDVHGDIDGDSVMTIGMRPGGDIVQGLAMDEKGD